MTNIILKLSEVSKNYILGERKISVLNNISLEINESEFVVISGSSGSGKTTLLSILSGLDIPSSGNVYLNGCDITGYREDQLAPIRNELTGFVFQAYHLVPSLNALENIMFPAELKNDSNARLKAEALLEKVGMSHRKDNFPAQMSGGEQQRVAICRALINDPKIVFCDEPTGNLDSENSEAIIDLLMDINTQQQTTLVIATHSSSLAEQADRVISLHDGVIMAGAKTDVRYE